MNWDFLIKNNASLCVSTDTRNLPAAGFRFGWFVYCVQGHGYYWSATENDSFRAYNLDFRWDGASMSDGYRLNGLSIRLVQDLQ